jgi:hypothetical protein
MTNLDVRPVRRETRAVDPVKRRKVLIVLLEVGGRVLRIKCKGDRRWYTVPYEEIYRTGCRIRAQEIKAEKAARRRLPK